MHASSSADSSYSSGATSSPSLPHSGGDALTDEGVSPSASISVGGGREWAIEGAALAKASDSQLAVIAQQNSVFSRTPAAPTCRLVAALRAAGHGVLGTGDGADDCAALDAAQVGCAMGRLGTDAVQEMAGLVLMQNSQSDGDSRGVGGAEHDTASSSSSSSSSSSLTNVVRAIRAGRAMAANLTRSFAFSVGCKFALLVSAIVALALGYPLPLASMHWIVLSALTDSIAATAFTHVTTDRRLGRRRLGPAPIGGRAEGREPPAFFGAAFRVRAATSAAVVAGAALLAMQLSLVWLPIWRGKAAFDPAPGAYPSAAVVGQMQTMVFVATTVSIVLLAWSMVASPPSSGARGWCRGGANFGAGAHIVLWWTSGIAACLAIAFLAHPTREVLSLNSLAWAQIACAVGAPIAVVAIMAAMRAIVRRCEGADGMAAGGCAAAFAADDDADA
jgi:magnesium-transporting ATPase (P-type)